MEINDSTIHRRIKRYRAEETDLENVIASFNKLKTELSCRASESEDVCRAYNEVVAAKSLVRKRIKFIRTKIENLKSRLSKEFWEGKNYNEV